MNELKPCPLCGAMPTVFRGVNVSCSTLGCLLQENTVSVERWNARPIEDKLRARIAELEQTQRWISVNERLPEVEDGRSKEYDVVLTYPFRREVIVATWSSDTLDESRKRRWFDCSSDEWGDEEVTEFVTHWRERPTPPEGE